MIIWRPGKFQNVPTWLVIVLAVYLLAVLGFGAAMEIREYRIGRAQRDQDAATYERITGLRMERR